MIYFNKIIPIIVSPLGLVIILLTFGIFWRKMLPLLVAVTLLLILSLPIVSQQLTGFLEKNYHPISANHVNAADTVVVLSGMIKTIGQSDDLKYEFNDAVDRILAGIQLLKLNKAKKIIVTRGRLPWSMGLSEGDILAEFIQSQGISSDKIMLTGIVQNTNDEAIAVSKILPKNSSIILVTSAFHMPRAEKVFQNQNFKVISYAVDFRKSEKKTDIIDFLPSSKSFHDSNIYFREMLGRAFYALRF